MYSDYYSYYRDFLSLFNDSDARYIPKRSTVIKNKIRRKRQQKSKRRKRK